MSESLVKSQNCKSSELDLRYLHLSPYLGMDHQNPILKMTGVGHSSWLISVISRDNAQARATDADFMSRYLPARIAHKSFTHAFEEEVSHMLCFPDTQQGPLSTGVRDDRKVSGDLGRSYLCFLQVLHFDSLSGPCFV